MQGLSFEVSKADTLKDDARKEAVANALRRAKLLAAAAGAEVGQVLQISEEVSSNGASSLRFTALCQSRDVRSDRTRHQHARSPRHGDVGVEVARFEVRRCSQASLTISTVTFVVGTPGCSAQSP